MQFERARHPVHSYLAAPTERNSGSIRILWHHKGRRETTALRGSIDRAGPELPGIAGARPIERKSLDSFARRGAVRAIWRG